MRKNAKIYTKSLGITALFGHKNEAGCEVTQTFLIRETSGKDHTSIGACSSQLTITVAF